ncbi:MAG TPA: CpsD/CapB family tyrosine-protein kinase [Planctomycetota bacterium]
MKHFLRVLNRRRTSAVLLMAAALAGYFVYSRTEKPAFRARALLRVQTPPALAEAARQAPWLPLTPADAEAWTSILSRGAIRDAATVEAYAAAPRGAAALALEAVAPTPDAAVAGANALAEAALREGAARAEEERARAVERLRDRVRPEREAQAVHARDARREREAARGRHGAENLDVDLRAIDEDVVAHEARRRELDRRLAANRLRLDRLRADRGVAEHLRRDSVPRATPGSARLDENPRVAAAADRVEALHRRHVALLRDRAAAEPAALEARAELREAELELSRARAAVHGQNMDRDELALLNDDELIAIEIRVLEPEIRALRGRAADLAPYLERARAAEAKAAEAAARALALETLAASLAPPTEGFVLIDDPAREKDAVRAEGRLRSPTAWLVATLLALAAGLIFAFTLEAVDATLKSDYDILRHLGWSTLAVVPRTSRNGLLALAPEDGARGIADVFDTLATVLLAVPSERPSRVFLVTSADAGEGKTSSSINLAAALARQGKRTLLVDGDLRNPTVHACFGLDRSNGLADLLAGRSMPATPGVFIDTQLPTLRLLTCGAPGDNLYEILDPARLLPVLGQLREQFDAIVVDSPPLAGAGDALKFSGGADAILFVVRAGATDVRHATWAKRLLGGVSAKVAGALLNQAGEPMTYYSYDELTSEGRRKLVRSSV